MTQPMMTPPKTPWQSRVGYYMIGIAIGLSILGAVNAIKKIMAAGNSPAPVQVTPAAK